MRGRLMPSVFVALLVLILVAGSVPCVSAGTVLDTTVTVDAGTWHESHAGLVQGRALTIHVRVVGGDQLVSFDLVNQEEYYNLLYLGVYQALIYKYFIWDYVVNWVVPYNDTFYFILSNYASYNTSTVSLKVYDQGDTEPGSIDLGVVGVVAAVAGIVLVVAVVGVAAYRAGLKRHPSRKGKT